MSDWWWYVLVVIVVVVVAAVLYMRSRGAGTTGVEANDPSRNYRGDRETDRLGGMSDEDREWESASLERNRKSQERQPPGTE